MKPITVKELYELCKDQIIKGNGSKVIMISQDDEGNGYHYLWDAFSSVSDNYAEDYINENISKEDNTIILG